MKMTRGKSQVLFRYLPFNVFNFDKDQGIFMVSDFILQEVAGDYDKGYLTAKINRYAERWNPGLKDFPKQIYPTDLYFAEPISVKARLFPLLFECTSCSRVHSYRSIDSAMGSITCRHCNSSLRQLHYIAIHHCGAVEQLFVPRCPVHGTSSIKLQRVSQRTRDFIWTCIESGCGFEQRLFMRCNCGIEGSPSMDIVNIIRPEAYYSHSINLINLRDTSKDQLGQNSVDYAKIIISAYLGIFDNTEQNFRAYFSNEDQIDDKAQQAIGLLQSMGLSESEIAAQMENILELSKAGRGKSKKREEILAQYDDLIEAQRVDPTKIYEELYEFVKVNDDPTIRTHATENFDIVTAASKLGFVELRFIENLPVTQAVFAYSRVSRYPNEAHLRCFPNTASTDGKFPVYVNTSETEAMLFRLDPGKVLTWLQINELLPGIDVDIMNDAQKKAWFINNLSEISMFGEVEDNDSLTRHVYGLVHSYAHIVLRQMSLLSGFDQNSLSEYLIPKALTFIIYHNNRQAFNIGGMFTLFEHRLSDLFSRIRNFGDHCVYDPVCENQGGACHSCIYIAEYSCQGYNQNLSRNLLYGGPWLGKSNLKGYLEL